MPEDSDNPVPDPAAYLAARLAAGFRPCACRDCGRWVAGPLPRGARRQFWGGLPLGPGGMGPGCDMPLLPRLPADAAIALCRGVGVGGACGTPPGSPVGGSPPGSPSAARGGASGGGPGSSRSRSPIRRPLLSGPGGALLRASGIASQEDLAYWWAIWERCRNTSGRTHTSMRRPRSSRRSRIAPSVSRTRLASTSAI